jgi:predicted transposase/invertase (TIGR01784 family)
MPEEKKFDHNELPEPENKDERKFRVYLSHDGFFRVSFDKNKLAESFARENLPEEITRDLDFSTLTLCKDTFVGRKLARSYSDVLYEIRFRNKPAYLYFLFEHKSWEPDFPGVQLLKNMAHIWEAHVVQYPETQKLPPIIPLLIYHGESPWKVDTGFISMFDIPETLEKYIPSFNYELYDISHMPEENIKGEVELRIVLMAFKYIFHPEIMSRLKNIFQLFRELPDKATFNEYLEMLLIYLGSNIKNVKFDQLQESVNDVIKEGGALMSTIFEEVLEKGKEIGLKEGIKEGEEIGLKKGEEKNKIRVAINCLMKGMDIETISEITDLPVERIKLLKTAVQQENAEDR